MNCLSISIKADHKFQIPEEYKTQLRYVESKDTRTDAEILESLEKHAPITSERNIWTYWHAGVQNMPSWTQRNIINWVRLHGPDWTVRILDVVPGSPNHALNWIAAEELPDSFVESKMTGPYVGPHSADFLRGAALYAYGGVWMDVGCILFRHLDGVCWNKLADDDSPFTIATPLLFAQYMANHFVAARKGDEFIKHWHRIFLELWKGRTDCTGVLESQLLTFMPSGGFGNASEAGYNWDFKVDEKTALAYVGQVVAWIRLTWIKEPNGGFDGANYWAKKVLVWPSLKENWPAENAIGFDGADLFKALTTRLDADPASEEYQTAHKVIWQMLTQGMMQKITHGKGLTHAVHCGTLFDMPENNGKDTEPGTFAELLRFGSVHLEQTREMGYMDAPVVDTELIIRKGLLEA